MNKLYVICRADLQPGAQLAQSCHALSAFAESHRELHREWQAANRNLVCLQIADEPALQALIEKARTLGIEYAGFVEPDYNNELTACAFGEGIGRYVSSLPLALRVKRAA